jgi:hypothetical protein
MKKVVSPDMVAHLWAAQSQSEARNAGGTFYFRDSTIYSYGAHFPIASFREALDGSRLILFTERSYSVTTSKHISITRSAIRHEKNVLFCYNPTASFPSEHTNNLRAMFRECESVLQKAAKAKSRSADYFRTAEQLVKTHQRYREAFGLELDAPLTIGENWKALANEKIAQQKEDAKKQAERKRQQDEAEQLARLEALDKWKAGEIVHHSFYGCPIALRLSSDGSHLETSRGAEVPTSHAKKLWKTVQSIKASGHAYQHNGHSIHIGDFRVDSISAEGDLRAGCHTIPFSTMAEFAGKVGWE